MKKEKTTKENCILPGGLHLFVADVVDEKTDKQGFWYIVGKTYISSFQKFIKWANQRWYRYAYYFYEAEEDTIKNFINSHENIRAGIYH